MGQACPGCGREYPPSGKCPACFWAEDAKRFAARPLDPPAAWTAYREGLRREREQREREREERDRARRVREAEQALADARALQEEIARRRAAANQEAKRVVTPAPPPPQPKNTETQPPAPAPATKKHPKTTEPHPPPVPPVSLPDRLRRAAHIERLTCESRFLDQRTEAAHRNFLKLLETVYPYEPGYGEWPDPAPDHPSGPDHPWRRA